MPRGADIHAKMRTVSRAIGCDVEMPSCAGGFIVYDPGLEMTFWEGDLNALHLAVYHARGRKKYEEQKGLCALCGSSLSRVGEIDHIATRAKGRDDSMGNLRILCSPCHRKRHGGK
jgi:hypothetical protein